MGAFAMSTGTLAQDAGEAFKQQREFDLKNQIAQSNIALQKAQAGEAEARSRYYDMGRYQPLTQQPLLQNGQWVIPMRDTRHPEAGITYIPVGAPANSIQGIFDQLKGAGITPDLVQSDPDLAQRLILGALFKGATGSAGTMVAGQHPTTVADAQGNPQAAVQDVLNNTVKPAGGAAKKPVPNVYQVVTDPATGNQVVTTVPKYGRAGANSSVPAQGNGAGVPAPSGSGGAGLIKKPAMLSPEASNMLMSLRSAAPMVADLMNTIQTAGKQNAGGLTDKIGAAYELAKYKMGFPTDNPFYQKAFALSDLYRNIITGLYTHGIRRGDLIEKIQMHMPTSGDTPAQMFQKAQQLTALNPQIEQAIVDFEKTRVRGIGAVDAAQGGNQVPAPLRQYLNMPGTREVTLSDGTTWHVGGGQAQQVGK